MNRLEIIKDIEKMETRKVEFENVLKDVRSYYFTKAYVGFDIVSQDFNKKYNGASIEVNKDFIINYLNDEIDELERKINNHIEDLAKGGK